MSMQWMDLELNQVALALSREVFYEGSERPRSVLDECCQRWPKQPRSDTKFGELHKGYDDLAT